MWLWGGRVTGLGNKYDRGTSWFRELPEQSHTSGDDQGRVGTTQWPESAMHECGLGLEESKDPAPPWPQPVHQRQIALGFASRCLCTSGSDVPGRDILGNFRTFRVLTKPRKVGFLKWGVLFLVLVPTWSLGGETHALEHVSSSISWDSKLYRFAEEMSWFIPNAFLAWCLASGHCQMLVSFSFTRRLCLVRGRPTRWRWAMPPWAVPWPGTSTTCSCPSLPYQADSGGLGGTIVCV